MLFLDLLEIASKFLSNHTRLTNTEKIVNIYHRPTQSLKEEIATTRMPLIRQKPVCLIRADPVIK